MQYGLFLLNRDLDFFMKFLGPEVEIPRLFILNLFLSKSNTGISIRIQAQQNNTPSSQTLCTVHGNTFFPDFFLSKMLPSGLPPFQTTSFPNYPFQTTSFPDYLLSRLPPYPVLQFLVLDDINVCLMKLCLINSFKLW
jgi:hypothetical protein